MRAYRPQTQPQPCNPGWLSDTRWEKRQRTKGKNKSFLFIDLFSVLLIVCEHTLAHPFPHKEWPLQLTPTISGETTAGGAAAASEPGGTATTTTLSLAIAHCLLWFAPELVLFSYLNSGPRALPKPALVFSVCFLKTWANRESYCLRHYRHRCKDSRRAPVFSWQRRLKEWPKKLF